MCVASSLFTCHHLDEQCTFFVGELPAERMFSPAQLAEIWDMHPAEYREIRIHGRRVKMPRWQEIYGADYHYTGQVNRALHVPDILQPLFEWAKEEIDARLNGLVVNWYDGKLGHYIGRHRDSIINMIKDAPIVSVSFGEKRIFRLRPWKGTGHRNFPTRNGSVFVMPFESNRHWTHEVPRSAKSQGRRISVTMRAFHPGALE